MGKQGEFSGLILARLRSSECSGFWEDASGKRKEVINGRYSKQGHQSSSLSKMMTIAAITSTRMRAVSPSIKKMLPTPWAKAKTTSVERAMRIVFMTIEGNSTLCWRVS